MKGTVSLIGAGPGDPELISVRGLKRIQAADIILYDALTSDELLKEAKVGAELIYVGKRCGRHSLKQPDINILLAQAAQRAQHVVRLKGGDPFVFGRGHEELRYLKTYNIPVEVVPGISSVTGLAGMQGVPLTRRHMSESFWVLTGTTKNHQLSQDLQMAVRSDATLVILMAMRKLEEITALLAAVGKQDIPMMIVQNGSTENEKCIIGEAHNILSRMPADYTRHPGIIVVGEVVKVHPDFVKAKANTYAI